MATRRFEMTEGSASKFWEISMEGSAFTVRYGRLGTDGQTQRKEFADEAKAQAAANKLVAEKTGKGYVEVGAAAPAAAPAAPAAAPATPAAAPAAPAAAPATPVAEEPAAAAPKKAKRTAAAKTEAPATTETAAKKATKKDPPPPLTLSNGDTLGSRALVNAAERFAGAATREEWTEACYKLKDASRTLVHLLAHDVFTPKSRLHAVSIAYGLRSAEPALVLKVLGGLDEALVAASLEDTAPLSTFGPILFRVHALAPDALRAASLPPTLAGLAAFVRAFAGEELDAEARRSAFLAGGLLARDGVSRIGEYDRNESVDPEQLAAAFERLGGPHWIRDIPAPAQLPWQTAARGLQGEPLEQVTRAFGLNTVKLLAAREDPPARFFAVADAMPELYAGHLAALRLRGIERAASPDEIPAGLEDLVEPRFIREHRARGFAALGTARLDAWALRWLEKAKAAPADEIEYHLDTLSELAFMALPFSDAARKQLLGLPRPYPTNPDKLDVRGYGGVSVEPALAPLFLRLGLEMAREQEAAGARPEILHGLRLWIAGVVASMPEDAAIDPAADAWISVGDWLDHTTETQLIKALRRLPPERAEAVLARTAHELDDPYRELMFARAGVSAAAVRRFARLVVGGRHDDGMWFRIRSGELVALGEALGPAIVEALGDETPSDTFLARLERLAAPAAVAHVRAHAKPPLDLQAEMNQLATELGGETLSIYALRPGGAAKGLTRAGGVPAGFGPDDVPRHRGRKLVHAFTLDLKDVPELARRYPDARTLSFWVQAYTESARREQALVPRTEAQIAAVPATAGGALELERLQVPAALFAGDGERARYARSLLFTKPGHLLGGPIWLQDGPLGVDPKFLAQFDERLARGANFGDMGVCYSFEDEATWQCH